MSVQDYEFIHFDIHHSELFKVNLNEFIEFCKGVSPFSGTELLHLIATDELFLIENYRDSMRKYANRIAKNDFTVIGRISNFVFGSVCIKKVFQKGSREEVDILWDYIKSMYMHSELSTGSKHIKDLDEFKHKFTPEKNRQDYKKDIFKSLQEQVLKITESYPQIQEAIERVMEEFKDLLKPEILGVVAQDIKVMYSNGKIKSIPDLMNVKINGGSTVGFIRSRFEEISKECGIDKKYIDKIYKKHGKTLMTLVSSIDAEEIMNMDIKEFFANLGKEKNIGL